MALRFVILTLCLGVLSSVSVARAQPQSSESEAEQLLARARRLHTEGASAEAGANAAQAAKLLEASPASSRATNPRIFEARMLEGVALADTGEVVAAERLFLDLLQRAEKPETAKSAPTLMPQVACTLGDVYRERGDYARAAPLINRGLASAENGRDDRVTASCLNNLALLNRQRGEHELAIRQYGRALELQVRADGKDSLEVAQTSHNLGALLAIARMPDEAQRFLERALAIRTEKLGARHFLVAQTLHGLGVSQQLRGDYAGAESTFGRALEIRKGALGDHHPLVANTLMRMSTVSMAQRNGPRALERAWQAEQIREGHLTRVLSAGSESQRLAYVKSLEEDTDAAISLHAQNLPDDPEALRLAFTTILRRKGRVLDALARANSGGAAMDQGVVDQATRARAALAGLVLQGPRGMDVQVHGKRVRELEADIDRLDAQLASQGPGRIRGFVTLDAVAKALPKDSSLVEIVLYHPLTVRATGAQSEFRPPRYVAYILSPGGAATFVDLGEATEIDRHVAALRAALADASKDAATPARALDTRLMTPIARAVGKTRSLFLSLDGPLQLVPFEALRDREGKYRLLDYSFTYLTSGRDVLSFQQTSASREPPLVLANPSFGERATGGRDGILGNAQFKSLPGTAIEAQTIAELMPQARVLLETRATEAALKSAHGPLLLHVATHGYFLADDSTTALRNGRGLELVKASAKASFQVENPLLRSGLALADANSGSGSESQDDGVLTGVEAASLDLVGTKLVVLSACETGVGQVENGEGVYGLRRGLVLAGAETQLITLWKVDDDATAILMRAFYTGLVRGEGRSEALHQAQRALLARPSTSHPFYWSAFIVSGNPAPLSQPPTRSMSGAPPTTRGCRCDLSSATSMPGILPAMVGFLVLLVRRRRVRTPPVISSCS